MFASIYDWERYVDPVAVAAARGDGARVAELLRDGSDPNALGLFGETPLHWAAMRGDRKMIDVLIAAGAWAGVPTRLHELPEEVAAQFGHPEVRDYLEQIRKHEQWRDRDEQGRATRIARRNTAPEPRSR